MSDRSYMLAELGKHARLCGFIARAADAMPDGREEVVYVTALRLAERHEERIAACGTVDWRRLLTVWP